MKRRGFFKSLALLAGAASLSPSIFVPKFEPARWKPNKKILLNPAYVNAPYEVAFVTSDYFGSWRFVPQELPLLKPYRYQRNSDGVFVPVAPFITV